MIEKRMIYAASQEQFLQDVRLNELVDKMKKIFEAGSDCKCSPNVIAWGKDDKYLYFKEGKFRDLKKIHRVPVDGGEAEEVIVFKDVFENATIINVDLHPDGNNMLVQIEAGKGEEIWKLDGLFNN